LIAGIALAAKTINPDIKIWGVQAEGCASMAASLAGECPVQIASSGTIADGIAVKRPGNMSFDLVRQYVDEVVVVSDLEIARAMLFLLERNKQLVEGSGAASVAALMFDKVDLPATDKTVAVVSGGNVDINLVSRIIERGLVEAGRYLTISTIVPDKPGYLNRLLNIISRLNANVISVHHHRIGTQIMPGQTVIELSLETRNAEHIEEIEQALNKEGYECNRLL
jgi:threonine dehydratase